MNPRALLLAAGLLPAVLSCDSSPAPSTQSSASRKAKRARARPKPPKANQLRGTLALPAGTRLHVEPSASAWGFDLHLGGIGEAELQTTTALFELKGERGGWLELETLTATAGAAGPNGCPPSVTGLDRLSLRLYVNKAGVDMSTLDARPLSEHFPCSNAPAKAELGEAADPPLPNLQGGSRYATQHSVEHELAAESTLYWPDGALAGRSTGAIRFLDAPESRGNRVCVIATVGDPEMTFEGPIPAAKLSLCAAASSFTQVPYEDPNEKARERAREVAVLSILGADEGAFVRDGGDINLAQLFAQAELAPDESLGTLGGLSDAGGLGTMGGLGGINGIGDPGDEGPTGGGQIAPSGELIGSGTVDVASPQRAQARWSGVRVSGDMSETHATIVLKRTTSRFRSCYERALMTSSMIPPTAMQFTLHFGPSGALTSSENEPKFAPSAQACLDAATSTLRSPAAGKIEAKIEFGGGGAVGDLPFD